MFFSASPNYSLRSGEKRPGVHIAKKNISKKCVFSKKRVTGGIQTIQKGDFIPSHQGEEIAVIGQFNIYFLSSEKYERVKKHNYNFGYTSLSLRGRLVDVDSDGNFEVTSEYEPQLIGSKGNLLWKVEEDILPHMNISGDLDNNGKLEFYTCGGNGIIVSDENGKKVKQLSTRYVSSINIVNSKYYRRKLLLIEDIPKNFMLIDNNGKVIEKINLPEKIETIHTMDISGEPYILGNDHKGGIYVYDLKGRLILQSHLTNLSTGHKYRGRAVRFLKNKEPYIAILASTIRTPFLNQISIFSPDKKLIYQETLKNSTGICVNVKKGCSFHST